jgi:hypothetical protein
MGIRSGKFLGFVSYFEWLLTMLQEGGVVSETVKIG